MPEENSRSRPKTNYSLVAVGLWLVAALFGFFHFAVIWYYSVDIPFQDEWQELPINVSPQWVWAQHNEHRIVLTKLIALTSLRLDGWNLAHLQQFNFVLYTGLIGVVLAVVKRSRTSIPAPVYPLVALWLLSPLVHENHQWAFQNQFHFVPIFLILAALVLGRDEERPPSRGELVGTGCFLLLGILSMSSGLLAAWVLLGLQTVSWRKQPEYLRALIPLWILVGLISAAYLYGLGKNEIATGPTGPWTRDFWIHFLTMMGAGWGLALPERIAWLAGPPFLLATIVPWIMLSRRPGGVRAVKPAFLAFAGMFLILVAISYGRGSFGPGQALASRYKEYSILLVPLCLPAWFAIWNVSPRWQLWGPRIALCVLATGWFVALDRFSLYRQNGEIRYASKGILLSCLKTGGACGLDGVAVGPISAETLEQASALSFIRSLHPREEAGP